MDGVFQILIKRISVTNWTYFVRDRILHPLGECLKLYRNIISSQSKRNPKWNELSETERDAFIAEAIENRYQWHKGCESNKASIEYLRKWSVLFLEEVLDERNFHCFAVRYFCREILTNNILCPIMDLVNEYNVNYAIVAAFVYFDENKEKILNSSKSTTPQPTEYEETIHNAEESETENGQNGIQRTNVSEEEISNQNDKIIQNEARIISNMKRKRRASIDLSQLNHYHSSLHISRFFIEQKENQSEILQLIPIKMCKGYSISNKYLIASQYRFTLRFVSSQCINLCARWVTLFDNQILGDLSSMKHLKRIEYEQNEYIYIWDDHKLHDYGDCYLQLGRQIIISTDIQKCNKHYTQRHCFVPLNIPLLHIYFTADCIHETIKKQETASSSISDGLHKIGNALNPLHVMTEIGDGIKKLLPQTAEHKEDNAQQHTTVFDSPSFDRKERSSLFGKSKKIRGYHHEIDDIGFMPSNKEKSKKEHRRRNRKRPASDESKLKLLAMHKPSTALTIRIWDVYRDFDHKMNPYVAYVLRIRDEVNTKRMEWTIKTRFSKLHSFHKAIQRDKTLKHIKIIAQFPAKSLITKMDAKYIADRKRQLIAYFNTLHRYPDVLLSQAVHQLVIPPVLVHKYQNMSTVEQQHPHLSPTISESEKKSEDKEKSEESMFQSTQPVLPSQSVIKPPSKENSPDLSLPMVLGADMAYFDDGDEEYINSSFSKPRRGSFPGCDAPNKQLIPPALYGDFGKKAQPKLCVSTNEETKGGMKNVNEETKLNEDSDDLDEDENKTEQNTEDTETPRGKPMESFRIEDYEHLTPSLIKVLEAFLDLEKRSTFGGGVTLAATSMMSWFFNGYIANKLYNQTAANLTMDGTLSFLAEWISDLLWIPPQYEMKEEKEPLPTDEEKDKLRVEARECIQKLFEVYIGDNVPKIIGQKKQLMLCMIKFWRFMQQNKLLKHLAFSILDALLQDLFPERVSRRYQRRAWMAEKVRKKEETKRKIEEKEKKQREKEKIKRLKQQQKIINEQQKRDKKIEPMLSKTSNGHRSDPMDLTSENVANYLRRMQSQETIAPSPANQKHDKKLRFAKKNGHQLSQSMNPYPHMSRAKTRPLTNNDSATPTIDLFSGGSLLSDYTKKFMGIGKKVKNDHVIESAENEDSSEESVQFEEQAVWNGKNYLAENGH